MIRCSIRLKLFAGLACMLGIYAAYAEKPTEKLGLIVRVRVPRDDLDLRKESDAQVMLSRLERAAYQACGGNPRFHTSYEVTPQRTLRVFRECQERAVTSAVAEINEATLTRVAEKSSTTR